ncbi:Dehydroquinate synthase-like protein [Xylariaceae sp. FL0255]|nr:Dehydroquinate synthase-like protein [Xylariaceae sp. FL0255]
MSAEQYEPQPDGEIFRPSFPDIDPAERPYTMLSYGLPFDKACKKHVDGFLNAKRVYIMASKGLSTSSNCVKRLEAALGKKHVGTWIGIPPHSPYDSLIPILRAIRSLAVDCLITIGGGSLTDGAKLVVYAAENGVDAEGNGLEDLIALEKDFVAWSVDSLKMSRGNAPRIATVFLPTTLSGGEYSKVAGCTNPRNHMKVQFVHPGMFAKLLVLDPDLCRTTPDWVWRSTGVRAIDHCVENICSKTARPESDVACERGLRRLVRSLLLYAKDPDDLDARLESQLGCNNAMTGLILMVLPGASHGIGHNLGPLGVGHGQTSCILLPAVMKYNAHVNGHKQEIVKSVLWSEPEISAVLQKQGLQRETSDAGDALRAIFDELGMPRSLKDVNVGRDKWDQLAVNSIPDPCTRNNPVSITKPEHVKAILEMCSGE